MRPPRARPPCCVAHARVRCSAIAIEAEVAQIESEVQRQRQVAADSAPSTRALNRLQTRGDVAARHASAAECQVSSGAPFGVRAKRALADVRVGVCGGVARRLGLCDGSTSSCARRL
jgi:hypothetical protein